MHIYGPFGHSTIVGITVTSDQCVVVVVVAADQCVVGKKFLFLYDVAVWELNFGHPTIICITVAVVVAAVTVAAAAVEQCVVGEKYFISDNETVWELNFGVSGYKLYKNYYR